jgi:hypothetical protein
MTDLDERRARSSFPNAILCFVAEFSTVIAPERLTAQSRVPGFMAMMALPLSLAGGGGWVFLAVEVKAMWRMLPQRWTSTQAVSASPTLSVALKTTGTSSEHNTGTG